MVVLSRRRGILVSTQFGSNLWGEYSMWIGCDA